MTRHINLLDPSLRVRRPVPTLESLAFTLAAVAVVLLAAHFFVKQRADTARQELVAAESQLRSDQERLVAGGKALSTARPDPEALARRDAARAALAARQGALEVLSAGSMGDTTGFAEQFRAFARASTPGLWLTGFTLSASGKDLAVTGRALRAEQVPAYIRRLKDEPVFRGKSFAVLRIDEARAEPPAAGAAAKAPAVTAPFVEFRLLSSADSPAASGQPSVPAAPSGARP